jgi:hypothetical protein
MMTLAFSSMAWGVRTPEWIHHRKNPKSAAKTAKGLENHAAVAAYRNGPYVKNLMAPNQAARYDYVAKRLRKEARSYREREKSEGSA